MNTLRLNFPDHQQADLRLGAGVSAIGRDPDHERALSVLPASSACMVSVRVDARGIWLGVMDGTWGVHVNGRPVVKLAMLRPGDVLHVEGREMVLIKGEAGHGAFEPSAVRAVALRGLGGACHGQALVLDEDAPRLAALRGVDVQRDAGQVRFIAKHGALLVNGLECAEALLRPGDQLVVPEGQRFLVEGTGGRARQVDGLPETSLESGTAPARARAGVPWLLLAAIVIALAMLGLFWFGG